MKALLRLYEGSIKALLRLYEGPIKALLRLYLRFVGEDEMGVGCHERLPRHLERCAYRLY
jgi:hypothetical protein